jgi:hypothetical protein
MLNFRRSSKPFNRGEEVAVDGEKVFFIRPFPAREGSPWWALHKGKSKLCDTKDDAIALCNAWNNNIKERK